MPPAKRGEFILRKLKEQLEYVYNKIPFYRELYERHGVKIESIRSPEDFTEKVPVVTQKMLQDSQKQYPPFGNYLGIDASEIFRIQGTSGTTGKPLLFGISREDWEHTAEATAMQCWAAGMRPPDVVQISFPMSLFVGGWGLLLAAERIGAKTLPVGGGETERQLMLMYELNSTVLLSTPGYCLSLLEAAKKMGKNPQNSPLRLGVFGGEPGAGIPEIKRIMEEGWGMKAIDFGNVAELLPCSNMECEERTGMHTYIDVDYTEVVKKDNPNELAGMGNRGSIIYTHLWRKSQPMIRYVAGDETVMIDERCPCGRTYPRLPYGVIGRLDDMMIVHGVNVYPSTIEKALRDVKGIGIEFRIYLEKSGHFDSIRVGSEIDPEIGESMGTPDRLETIKNEAERKLKNFTGVRIPVTMVKPGTFSRATLKARRVIDQRPRESEKT